MNELDDRGVEMLSAAVVVQAVRDWQYCRMMVESNAKETDKHKHDGEGGFVPARRLIDVERFFLGRWFGVICHEYNGAELLERLREMNVRQLSLEGLGAGKKRSEDGLSWRRLTMYPELQQRLRENKITQQDICKEIGICNPTLACWLKKGLDEERLRMVSEAAERIITRRATQNG